jgi:hypothetical protein
MKVPKKALILLAGIFTITVVAYFLIIKTINRKETAAVAQPMIELPLPQANTKVNPDVLEMAPPMPKACDMTADNMIANFPDLDRAPLDDESLTLLPANEMIASNYKDWYVGAVGANEVGAGAAVDKELYAKGKPLFKPATPLVPLDVNDTKRRINFY